MKENLSPKSWIFDPDAKFVKCPKLVREAPRATQKNKKKYWAKKGPGPKFGPMGPTVTALGDIRGSPTLKIKITETT